MPLRTQQLVCRPGQFSPQACVEAGPERVAEGKLLCLAGCAAAAGLLHDRLDQLNEDVAQAVLPPVVNSLQSAGLRAHHG